MNSLTEHRDFDFTAALKFTWLRSSLILSLLLIISMGTYAGDKKWEGDVSSDWNDKNNWAGDKLPGGGDDVTINPDDYTYAPVISSNSSFSPKKVTITGAAVLTIQADFTCKDEFKVDGEGSSIPTVNMSGGELTISTGKKLTVKKGAVFNLTGGTIDVTDDFTIEAATFNMNENDGTSALNVDGVMKLKANATSALFNMDAGTVTVDEYVWLDGNDKAPLYANIDISGGTFTNNAETYFGKDETDNITTLILSGGTTTLTGEVVDDDGGQIDIDISGGNLIFQGDLTMESGDRIDQDGGTITFEGGDNTWDNDGVLNATAGTIVFNDPTNTDLTGTGTWDFFNVTINSGMTMTQSDDDFNVAGNWTNSGGTYVHSNNDITFNGTSGTQTISAETFYSMTINNSGSGLSLSGNVQVNNTLTMTQGDIDANGNKLTLGTSGTATLNHTSGTIIGQFERWIDDTSTDILFPVGTASNYRPGTLNFTNLTTGSLIVEFVASDPGDAGLPVNENGEYTAYAFDEGYWDLTVANSLASTDYSASLVADGFSSYDTSSITKVILRDDAVSNWTLEGSHVPFASVTAGRTGFNGATAQLGIGFTSLAPSAAITDSSNISCNGLSDGSADLTVTDGTLPFTYAWSNSATSEDVSGLTAGTYTVTVTDALSLTATASVDLTEPATLSTSSSKVDQGCNAGSIDLTPAGGTTPYTYLWSNSATSQDLSGLTAGSYTVTVTDDNGCTATESITINNIGGGVELSSSTTAVNCYGGSDGAINLTVDAGVAPFTYSWSSGESTEDISGKAAGSYTVTVTDDNSCSATTIVSITEPAAALSGSISGTNLSSIDTDDGSADLTPSGGTAPYTYSWSNGAATQDISSLAEGTYTVTITDNNTCTATASVNIVAFVIKQLYLTDPSQGLDRIDPVASTDATTASTDSLGNATIVYPEAVNTVTHYVGISTKDPAEFTISNVTVGTGTDRLMLVGISTKTAEVTSVTYGGTSMTLVGANVDNGNAKVHLFKLVNPASGTANMVVTLSEEEKKGTIVGITNFTGVNQTTPLGTFVSAEDNSDNPSVSVSAGIGELVYDVVSIRNESLTVGSGQTQSWNIDSGEEISGGGSTKSGISVTMNWTASGAEDWAIGAVAVKPSVSAPAGTTIDLVPIKDTYIRKGSSNNNGSCTSLYIDRESGDLHRALLQFDLSSIPAGAVIVAADLRMNCTNSGGDMSISVYEVGASDAWDEGSACGGSGQANWTQRTSSSNWSSTGVIGDPGSGTPVATINSNSTGIHSWPVTALVEDWHSGSATNNGVMVGSQDGGGNRISTFDSRESSGTAPVLRVTYVDNDEATFTQGAALCSDLTIKSGQTITVTNYVTIATGTMPASPSITAELKYDTTSIITLSDPTYSGGLLTWTGTLGSDVTVPAGQAVTLVINTTQSGVTFEIDYDSQSKPSKISLPVTTCIDITSYAVYDAAYPGGSIITTADSGTTFYPRAVVTDPFGFSDITGMDITITPPGSTVAATSVDSAGCTRTYEYTWIIPDTAGAYTIPATAKEGLENTVTDVQSLDFSLCPLRATSTKVDIACYGQSTGSIDLTPTIGTSPYTYAWSSGDTTQDISGKAAGSYTVTITDANACTFSDSITITQPAQDSITFSATTVNVTCNGGSDATIIVGLSGGSPPYSILWSNGDTVLNPSGLDAGSYTLTVTDTNGCDHIKNYTVTSPSEPLDITYTGTTALCAGDSIQLTFSGASNFFWSPSGGLSDSTIANPIINPDTTTVYYIRGESPGASNLVANGDFESGNIGFSSTYTYTPDDLSPEGRYGIGTDPNDYHSNFHGFDHTSGSGKFMIINGAVTENQEVWCQDLNVQEEASYSFSTFIASVHPSNPAELEFSINGSLLGTEIIAPDTINTWAEFTAYWISDTSAARFCIVNRNTVPSGNDFALDDIVITPMCTDIDTITIEVNPLPPIDADADGGPDQTICYGDTAALTASGGTTFAWSIGDTTASINVAPTTNTTYNVTVTDANGCRDNDSVNVTVNPQLSISASKTDVTCKGYDDGSIDITPAGGTTPYSYSWSTGASTQDISGLSPGAYTVTLTDDNSCSTSEGFTINESAVALSASVTGTDANCANASSGSADLTVTGGTAPYSYLWSNSATTEDISSITPATYTVTVTDDYGCTSSDGATISQDIFTANISGTNTCLNDNNGAADLSLTDGTPPYNYLWSSGATSEDLSSLSTGTYTVTVTENNGCADIASVDIINLTENLSTTISKTDVSTAGGSDGTIDLSVSGDAPPYGVSWSSGPTTEDLSNITAGFYSVTVTDFNGCSVTDTITVTQPCVCTWTGTTDVDWNNSSNWNITTVPTQNCDVIIPSGMPNDPELSSDGSAKNLTIQAGGEFSVSGKKDLNIYGDFVNDGTFIGDSGTVIFKGSGEQSISGSGNLDFNKLEIANSSSTGIVLNSTITVADELIMGDGHIFTNSDTVIITSIASNSITGFGPQSHIVGKLCRYVKNTGKRDYDFPVGDEGTANRYFRAMITTHNLQGTTNLTVWFDSLTNHSNEQLEQAILSPPNDIADYYPDTVNKIAVENGDTVTSLLTLLGGYTSSDYVNNNYNMNETVQEDGIPYSFLAPEGIWHFEPDQEPTGGFYHMRLYITNLSGLTDNNFGILKRPSGTDGRYWCNGGGEMKPFGGAGRKKSDGYALRMYLTTFSEGGAGGGSGGGLPIQLLNFNASLIGDKIEITWATASEINNDFFTIEKSNGDEFKQIALVPGAGNSSETLYYAETDYDPYPGISYYRLKQTDYDGKFEYSDIVSVKYEVEPVVEQNEIVIFPNPSTGEFSILLKNPAESVRITLFDASGKLIHTENYTADHSNHTHLFHINRAEPGIYHLKIQIDQQTSYSKQIMLMNH